SSTFAANRGNGMVTVFDGLLSLASSGTGTPNPFDIVINVASLFNYDPTKGNLLLDVFMRNSPATTFFDSVGSTQTVTAPVFSPTSVTDATGTTAVSGLVTRFDFAAPPEDWYAINLTDTSNFLSLATSTPAGGPGEFANNLSPQIELYDPSGTLVASGVV